ncbi:hypothetical protein [Methylibium rhizosphaerae]|uniref:hypothetical protein n=1 Tax=Methylibium rhizosphaerae TaxID=2570323 RepID=UPI00112D2169|nr:hypothetical protein [Methylibium rhizosphaerae]
MNALQRIAVWATPGLCTITAAWAQARQKDEGVVSITEPREGRHLNPGPGFVSRVNADKVQLYGGPYR